MSFDFWDVLPAAYLVLVGLIGIAALWPPLSLRRLVMALTLVAGAVAVALATFSPTVNWPSHFVVVAECLAFENEAAFTGSLSKPLGDRQILSEVTYRVLSDPRCADRAGGALKVSGNDLGSAMAAARQAFEAMPPHLRWRANRLILVGVPDGPLSQARGLKAQEEAQEHLGMVERLRIAVEYHAINAGPDQRLAVTAPLWRATPVGRNSSALRLEFTSDNIGTALSIKLDIVQHARLPQEKSGCEVRSLPPPKVNPTEITTDMLNGVGDRSDELRIEWPEGRGGRRLVVTMAYLDQIADRILEDSCGSWWSFVDVTATVSWRHGAVPFHGSAALGRAPEPMLTLYTPQPLSSADRHAGAGWEMSAADLISPAPAWGLSQLLATIFAEKDARTTGSNDWALRSPWRTLWLSRDCWFQGPDDLLRPGRKEKFRECLVKSRRLAVVSPTADAIRALAPFDIERSVADGTLHTLVAAPEYDAAEARVLPAWAVPATPMQPPTVSMPIIVASPTTSGLINRGAAAKPGLQTSVLERLAAPGIAGSAEGNASCMTESEPINTSRSLFWFAPQSSPVPVPPTSPRASSHAQIRLRGLLQSVAPDAAIFPKAFSDTAARGRLGSKDSFEDNLRCDNPVKRTVDAIVQLEQSGLYRRGLGRVPRAVILLFDTDQPAPLFGGVPDICNNRDPGRYDPVEVTKRLNEFAAAGGRILVQPIVPSINFDQDLYRGATAQIGGGQPLDTVSLIGRYGGLADTVVPLDAMSSRADPATVARRILSTIESNWNAVPVADGLRAESADYGTLGTRNAACALDLATDQPRDRYHCLHVPPLAGRRHFATALNRTGPVPEFFTAFAARPEDRLVSGQLQLGDGNVLRQAVQIGRGKSVMLGYSPFARDQLAVNFLEAPASIRLKRGLCFLMNTGTNSSYIRAARAEFPSSTFPSSIFPRDGGMALLDRFAQAWDHPVGAPMLDTITNRDPATGAFTLVAYAQPRDETWSWRLTMKPADSPTTPFPSGKEPAALILQSFNPATGEARISLEPRISGYSGAVAISLSDHQADPIVLPLVFPPQRSTIDLSKVVDLLNTKRSSSARLTLDASAAAVPVLIICALIMFSPFARSWAAAAARLDRWRSRNLHEASLPPRPAPLFALEAALSEWGAHPGQPAATRNAGLPAGIRQWRAGDTGRAIIAASLYGLLARGAVVPIMKPRVRLKTASQATSILVLLEGTDAMSFPTPRNSPSKRDFAASLAAFLAGAVTMSHGRAEVARVGHETILTGDGGQLRSDIQLIMDEPPSFGAPADFLQKQGGASLVFFVVDGLSINSRDLVAMADVLAVDGNQLRVAAVVSDDDRYGAVLSRDPRNGAFEDASEIHPKTFVELRDARLDAARFELDRRGAQLVVFPAEGTTQETLRRFHETGFLA